MVNTDKLDKVWIKRVCVNDKFYCSSGLFLMASLLYSLAPKLLKKLLTKMTQNSVEHLDLDGFIA